MSHHIPRHATTTNSTTTTSRTTRRLPVPALLGAALLVAAGTAVATGAGTQADTPATQLASYRTAASAGTTSLTAAPVAVAPKSSTRPVRPPSKPRVWRGTPTPTPTTTPTTPPVVTTPPPAPSAGGYGVPAGTALKASGSVTVSTAGAVVDGLNITGCLTVTAKNVTVRNTKISGTCDLVVNNRATGLVLDHVEIDGKGAPTTLGIGYGDFTLRGSYVHGVGDGVRANGNVVVESSYITDLATGGGSHNDGIQVTEGANIRISGNVIENRYTQTSAILIGADQGNVANVLVENNVLAGGGYTLYGGAQPPAGNTISNIVIRNNQFSKKYFAKSGAYGPMTATNDSRISVSGNVWQGTQVSAP